MSFKTLKSKLKEFYNYLFTIITTVAILIIWFYVSLDTKTYDSAWFKYLTLAIPAVFHWERLSIKDKKIETLRDEITQLKVENTRLVERNKFLEAGS